VLPREAFTRRADRQARTPSGPSYRRALAALDPPGSVLDVGAGAGAASLPLAAQATSITAVDEDGPLLAALVRRGAGLDVPIRTVEGRWPDVASDVDEADVVCCHHVLYNVPDIEDFVRALTAHARGRVVVEITARHPLVALNPLWRRFHGLERPDGPSAGDAVGILRALGLDPQVQAWSRPAEFEHRTFDDVVELTRRRLCLPPERTPEVADAVRDCGLAPADPDGAPSPPRQLVTIWWPGAAR
jgi:SAM-dependent methyltransferase